MKLDFLKIILRIYFHINLINRRVWSIIALKAPTPPLTRVWSGSHSKPTGLY